MIDTGMEIHWSKFTNSQYDRSSSRSPSEGPGLLSRGKDDLKISDFCWSRKTMPCPSHAVLNATLGACSRSWYILNVSSRHDWRTLDLVKIGKMAKNQARGNCAR
ncbi:hypothetical protein CIHG_07011 [Coccidioides immitis H538.4]|uniref:Uncharacterized protein n=1 Tax=Coccidioides immitis H538.4 TaxID=396776 RepID=A0A0J8UP93_COCIT|nr:hypothetical protein CIHG_07011 [Coccidioides immitis H538.4]